MTEDTWPKNTQSVGDNSLYIICLLTFELSFPQGLETKQRTIKSPVLKFIQICLRFFCVTSRKHQGFAFNVQRFNCLNSNGHDLLCAKPYNYVTYTVIIH